METKVVAIRMSLDLVERIDAACDNRNAFVIEAVEEKLNPVKVEPELTDTEKRNVLKGTKNLSDMLGDALLQEAAKRKNFLSSMDNESFAKLVASRLPKEENTDAQLDADVLSLQECLAALPSIEDITYELNKVKGKLFKAEKERDINLKLLQHSKGKAELQELMGLLFRDAVEYVVDLVARNNLPGFGDGGGLTEQAYADIASKVKAEMDHLEIFRRKA